MEEILRQILEMSLYGSIAIVCVMLLRVAFRKMSKRITCLFWSIAGIRLLCPFNIGSRFSLMSLLPHAAKKVPEAPAATKPAAQAAENIVPEVTQALSHGGEKVTYIIPAKDTFKLPSLDLADVLFAVWVVVLLSLACYFVYQAVKMRRTLREGKVNEDGTVDVSDIRTAFVTGLVRPRIYIPEALSDKERKYILLHEKTHIRYHDQFTKLIGTIAVCIHWFNPLVWAAYILFSRDLEMRVDETVIDTLGEDIKKEYCMSLVSHARTPVIYRVLNTAFSGSSFGSTEVKMRITNLIDYKKTPKTLGAIVLITSLSATAVLSSCAQEENVGETTQDTTTTTTTQAIEETSSSEETSGADLVVSSDAQPDELVLYVIRTDNLNADVEYVTDYGTQNDLTWDEAAPSVVISSGDIENETIAGYAAGFEAEGLPVYDLSSVNEQLGGIAPDEGIVTVNGDSITVVFRANEGDMAAICGQCQNDNIPYRIQGTAADYYDCVELVNNLQESGYMTASVQVSTERVDEEDIYYYEIESLCERSENDQLVQIEWDSENEVICMTLVAA